MDEIGVSIYVEHVEPQYLLFCSFFDFLILGCYIRIVAHDGGLWHPRWLQLCRCIAQDHSKWPEDSHACPPASEAEQNQQRLTDTIYRF